MLTFYVSIIFHSNSPKFHHFPPFLFFSPNFSISHTDFHFFSSFYPSFQLHFLSFTIILNSSFKLSYVISHSPFLHFITKKSHQFFHFSSFHTPFPPLLRIFLLTSLHNSHGTLKKLGALKGKVHQAKYLKEPQGQPLLLGPEVMLLTHLI